MKNLIHELPACNGAPQSIIVIRALVRVTERLFSCLGCVEMRSKGFRIYKYLQVLVGVTRIKYFVMLAFSIVIAVETSNITKN
jgi:hypothetical protein